MNLPSIGLGLLLAAAPVFAQDPSPVLVQSAPAAVEVVAAPTLPNTQSNSKDLWDAKERLARVEEMIAAPLSVNGVKISREEIRRALLLKVGRLQLEDRKSVV